MNEWLLFLDIQPWIEVFKELGVLAALAAYFTWQSWKREERLANKVDTLEKFIEDKLLDVIQRSLNNITENSTAMGLYVKHMENFVEKLSSRPCLYEDLIRFLGDEGYSIIKKQELKDFKKDD